MTTSTTTSDILSYHTENFAELFEASCAHNMRSGDIVTGRVEQISNDWVTVSTPAMKSEGLVPVEQFRNAEGELTIAEGDEVVVAIETSAASVASQNSNFLDQSRPPDRRS